MLNMMMGVMASSRQQDGGLFTITVGGFTAPKSGTYRGYSKGPVVFGGIDRTFFEEYEVLSINIYTTGTLYYFRVTLGGNAVGRTLRMTPQNQGGSPQAVGTSVADGTLFSVQLANANLFNNWALGTVRTCELEFLN